MMSKRKTILVVLSVLCLAVMTVSCSDKGQETKRPEVQQPAAKVAGGEKSGMVEAGMAIFVQNCQVCHGEGGKGDICPDLTDAVWKYGNSDKDIYQSISRGRPEGMPAWESTLGEEKIREVMAYISSIGKK